MSLLRHLKTLHKYKGSTISKYPHNPYSVTTEYYIFSGQNPERRKEYEKESQKMAGSVTRDHNDRNKWRFHEPDLSARNR